jgi:hypothetical protein
MSLTQTWKLQGTADTTIDATDSIKFSDGTFDNPVQVGSYNDGTHVRSSGGADDSDGNTPNNVKYVASGTADWGDGTEDVANILDSECTLKLTISESTSITVTDITFYAYDGTTTTNAPSGVTFYALESGDAAWTEAHGSGNALSISDSDTPAEDHYFYIAVSASPDSVGVKSENKARVEFTYQ